MTLFAKDPDAVLDYRFDWSGWLEDAETIDTSVMTVEAGITKNSDSSSTTTATVWLSGGTVGTTYSIANKVTTSSGRTDERTIQIRVENR